MSPNLVPGNIFVVVGSKSRHKLEATDDAIRHVPLPFVGIDTRSGINPQPFEDEANLGAYNRALAALTYGKELYGKERTIYGLGIENGIRNMLFPVGSHNVDVGVIVLMRAPNHFVVTTTAGVMMPATATRIARETHGGRRSVAEVFAEDVPCDVTDLTSTITMNAVSRKQLLTQAIYLAFSQMFSPHNLN